MQHNFKKAANKELTLEEFIDPNFSATETVKVKNRTIYIFGEIKKSDAQDVMMALDDMESDPEITEVLMYINSPGGSTAAAFTMVDRMRNCTKPIKVVGAGEICSAATLILAAGTKGLRSVYKHSVGMIHQPWIDTDAGGLTAAQSLDQMMKICRKNILAVMVKDTTPEQEKKIRQILRRVQDTYLTAEEMVNLGLADQII